MFTSVPKHPLQILTHTILKRPNFNYTNIMSVKSNFNLHLPGTIYLFIFDSKHKTRLQHNSNSLIFTFVLTTHNFAYLLDNL